MDVSVLHNFEDATRRFRVPGMLHSHGDNRVLGGPVDGLSVYCPTVVALGVDRPDIHRVSSTTGAG